MALGGRQGIRAFGRLAVRCLNSLTAFWHASLGLPQPADGTNFLNASKIDPFFGYLLAYNDQI